MIQRIRTFIVAVVFGAAAVAHAQTTAQAPNGAAVSSFARKFGACFTAFIETGKKQPPCQGM